MTTSRMSLRNRFAMWLSYKGLDLAEDWVRDTDRIVKRVGLNTLHSLRASTVTPRSATVTHDGLTYRFYSLHPDPSEDPLKALENRLVQGRESVLALADSNSFKSEEERTRLRGKAEGVGLALSYLREALRDA